MNRHQPILHLALAVGAVFILAPFVLMLVTAFSPPGDLATGRLVPDSLTLENFRAALGQVPIIHYYLNGLLVTTTIFVGQVLLAIPAAYALARLRFRGSQLGLWTVLVCLMVPYQVTAIPVYVLLRKLDLINTLAALVLPFIGSAFGVYLLRQFFLTIPQAVFDAARIDGAGTVAVLTRVVLPMSRPALVAFGIFSFVGHWNDYFWPSFVLTDDHAATVPFGIVAFLNSETGTDYGPQMATATLAVLPLLVGFLLAQRQFIGGLALSGQPD
jgi:multiple sugar transport system permease protein